MMTWNQLNLQDSVSPMMDEFIFFHDFITLILIVIISFVGVMMLLSLWSPFVNVHMLENQMLEMVWTVLPGVVLVYIAMPSLCLLYMFEEGKEALMTVKAIGYQWYWSYEYVDFWLRPVILSFDSYMLPESDEGSFRLLDVDSRLVLPYHSMVRMLVSSGDVLHSWSVPSLGVKADAVPGRLNQLWFMGMWSGVYYGQCSEICGANHSFMPIVVEFCRIGDFLMWAEAMME